MAGADGAIPPEVSRASRWIAECDTLHTRDGHRLAYRVRGSGAAVLLLHGFPTWSFDFADVADDLADDHTVVTLDFLGYGASDKPNPHAYSVAASADAVEDLVSRLELDSVTLVVHDYGGIVGQELLDRHRRGALGFAVDGVVALNFALAFSAYRPTLVQRLLSLPLLGKVIAGRVTADRVRSGLDAVRGRPLTDTEFDDLWLGISRAGGHRLAHLLIRYNAERAVHHRRWEDAVASWPGPLHLVWGLDDPVSGRAVLAAATPRLPHARVTALDGVGHFPQSEAPWAVAAAVRTLR